MSQERWDGFAASGVVIAETDRYEFPIPRALRNKLEIMTALGPHSIIGYAKGCGFRRERDQADFYLVPAHWPFLVRVPLRLAYVSLMAYQLICRGATVLISTSPYDALPLCVSRGLARLTGRRTALVVQIQGEWEHVLPLVYRWTAPLRPAWGPLMRWVVRRADVVRAVSGRTERIAREFGAQRVVTFPTWTDFEFFESQPRLGNATNGKEPSVMFAGTLTRVKGVDVLLKAVQRAQARGVPARLTVSGDGPERAALQSVAKELRLNPPPRWEGHVSQDRLRELLDETSVFVLPSRTEGLPRVVIEALLRARPVIGTRVGGIPDIIDDGTTGFLVPPDDPVALAERLELVLRNPEDARAMGIRGREAVRERYGVDAYRKGYRELLERARRALGENG